MGQIVKLGEQRRAWAERIGRSWSGMAAYVVVGVIRTGQLLINAKAKLEHGEFISMVEGDDLPFKKRTAQCLMRIAADQRICEMAKAHHDAFLLPSDWNALYAMTRLSDDEFTEFMTDHASDGDVGRAEIGIFKRLLTRRKYAVEVQDGGTTDDLYALAKGSTRFRTIYADPPWTFEVYSGKGKERSAERHYDTMSLEEIAALPIEDLAADDCCLFLWCVWPELPGALKVIRSWGFEYKTAGFLWVKTNKGGEGTFTGMGYWTRANSEPCLFATRGSPDRLSADVHQVISAPVRAHSVKPDEARVRIERLVPGPYLELFGRSEHDGWTVWGNQIRREAAE